VITGSKSPIKGFDVACDACDEHCGTHGDDSIDAALDQACRHTTEGAFRCSLPALARCEDDEAHAPVSQRLGYFPSPHEVKVTLCILKRQFSFPPLFVEGTMPIKVQDMDGPINVLQAVAQCRLCRGTKEF